MVCTANDLLEWKDFPKGLRVLLLDEDSTSSSQIKSKLQEMEYIVASYFSEQEALSTIESKNESFHVAIVEINAQNSDTRCKFLESAKDLPIIMVSKENCLSTMMKCIALGAVEFLIKPLSEEKLRNIWQHVVHKAFSRSGSENTELLKSVKEFVGSVLKLQQLSSPTEAEVPEELQNDTEMDDNYCDQSAAADKFPAPSTPQIKQGGRSLDDGDYHDQTNGSPVKETGEADGETKSVDTTCDNNSFSYMEVDPPEQTANVPIKEEEDCSDGSKGSDDLSSKPHDKEEVSTPGAYTENSNKESTPQISCRPKSNRKKGKVDWTPDLHKKFVQAVEKLGVDQAIPSRILELMKVDGLTRHNVASHLQKYRMNRRHILPKEEERRWPQLRDSVQRNYYTHHRPVMAYPPYQTNHAFAPGQVYPAWGQQGVRPPGLPMWSAPTYPWPQPVEGWHWKPYPPAMHADAWGCPVLPPPHQYPPASYPEVQVQQPAYQFQSPDTYVKSSSDTNPGEEEIDKVVKEAISKPWLPLPIGLKPPSTDSVLSELSRQGISAVPPRHVDDHHHC